MMTLSEYNDMVFKIWNEAVLEACPNCDRTFKPEGLARHIKSCKPAKTLGRTMSVKQVSNT